MLNNRYEYANNIHRLYPNANIILVLRDKKDLLNSQYNQYVKMGGVLNFSKWCDLSNIYAYLDFDRYVKYLKSLFGCVGIFNFEVLASDVKSFVSDICSFIGVDCPDGVIDFSVVNESVSAKKIRWVRIFNRFWISEYNSGGFIYRKGYSGKY